MTVRRGESDFSLGRGQYHLAVAGGLLMRTQELIVILQADLPTRYREVVLTSSKCHVPALEAKPFTTTFLSNTHEQ
jgi:hypothetical protein